jgi:hypothetical protein
MSVLDQLKEITSKREAKLRRRKKKRERKENCRKLGRKLLEQPRQFTLNHLHQGHLLYFEKVVRILRKKEIRT